MIRQARVVCALAIVLAACRRQSARARVTMVVKRAPMRRTYFVGATLLLVLACAQAPNGGGGPSDAGGPSDGPTFGFDASADSGDCTQCSADLHEIVTCGNDPQVVKTCAADQGCGGTDCVAACDAAAANKSSIGCDYYAIPPDVYDAPQWNAAVAPGDCFAAFVTNNWSTDMTVSLVWKGTTINGNDYAYFPQGSGSSLTYKKVPSTGIPPNSMAIVFLNDDPTTTGQDAVRCPTGVKAAVTKDMVIHGTSISNALEIKTSVPAVVYDIYPYGGAKSYLPSATLLLPTSSWDTNYVAATMSESAPAQLPSGVDLVAQQDGTQVTLLPTTDVLGGTGVAATSKGVPVTYTIDKGQTVHITQPLDGAGNDLTGSIIQSNKPIGLWGERFCEYASNRWRIVGAVDGTILTYDPAVPGAPSTLSEGQLVEFSEYPTIGPDAFHVRSQDTQHPFYLAAHRRAQLDCDAAHQQIPPIKALGNDYVAVANEADPSNSGGPETVNVVPDAQFLSSYIFFTDPTYGYTEIALTRVKGGDGTFHDVTLDCLGTVNGWQAVGTSGQYQYAHVDVKSPNKVVGTCDNGLHTIKSDVPFGITVWGWDSAASYAYPAGMSVKPINSVVVPPAPH